ncbi:M10 family metallopeptidase C-terminal domain-containing protein [Methylobacterium nodulans]|uniref:Hemolysin-type calcium-binding region n=1 Tax=Methylobacterium nodulans (strain LMG 21967 / CNCM I-2342 / ORS 2060) TaxID=460265 RepID=B8IGD0_METNO|nr:M10 family metallopeptidase C-terminal domain-containing protein [Methylobacterium nodulans]ACL55830.1 Hemolysin-type calcium-binding region [Methylobacterium nodulans ORS 2060]
MALSDTDYYAALRAANPDVAPIPGIDAPVGYIARDTPPRSAATLGAADGVYYNKALNTVVIYQAGVTLDNIDFRGTTVFVQANDVTIRNSLFDAAVGAAAVVGYPGYANLTIDHSTFDGLKLDKYYNDFVVAQGLNTTLTNNAFLNAPSDALYLESGRVAGNYIAGGGYQTGAHADGIWIGKSTGPITIEGNLLDWRSAADAKVQTNNALRITAEKGDVSNVTVRNNVLLGGSYTVSVTDTGADAGNVAGVSVTGNVVDEGQWGNLFFSDRPGDLVYAGNHDRFGIPPRAGTASTGPTLAALTDGTTRQVGSAQNDALLGSAGRDFIQGGDGQDWISAGGGGDVIEGGAGRDYLYGDAGADSFLYRAWTDGRDLISDFVPGADKIRLVDLPGAPQEASSWTWLGERRFDGNPWELRAVATATGTTMVELDRDGDMTADFEIEFSGQHSFTAADFILGIGTAAVPVNTLTGTDGADVLTGSAQADLIQGGAGGDSIKAGDGDDTILGGAGKDIIATGAGRDRLVYETITDSLPQSRDYLTDFTQGQDQLDLAAIDAVDGTPANEAFTWLGTGAFDGRAGELRYGTTAAGSTLIQADITGDKVADFAVELAGAIPLKPSDFVL